MAPITCVANEQYAYYLTDPGGVCSCVWSDPWVFHQNRYYIGSELWLRNGCAMLGALENCGRNCCNCWRYKLVGGVSRILRKPRVMAGNQLS